MDNNNNADVKAFDVSVFSESWTKSIATAEYVKATHKIVLTQDQLLAQAIAIFNNSMTRIAEGKKNKMGSRNNFGPDY